jgi:hypothetical protein
MPRQARLDAPGLVHHVTRGIEDQLAAPMLLCYLRMKRREKSRGDSNNLPTSPPPSR